MSRKRYYSQEEEPGLRWERIAGWTVVLALHIGLGMMLMAPVNMSDLDNKGEDIIQVVIIDPPPAPPPPPPPPPEEKKVEPEPPKKVVTTPPPPKPQPKPSPRPAPTVDNPPVVFEEPSPMDTQAPPPSPPAPPVPQGPTTPPGPPGGSGALTTLHATTSPQPPYPRDALLSGIQGTVVLRITVGPNGVPTDVKIEKSSGHRGLDRETQRFVKSRWRFQATGQVEVGILPVDFRLN